MPRALIFGMKHNLVDLSQVCSYYPWGQKWSNGGVAWAYIKSNFSEYGHAAYLIKGNA